MNRLYDIIIPEETRERDSLANMRKFIRLAKRLGYSGLIILAPDKQTMKRWSGMSDELSSEQKGFDLVFGLLHRNSMRQKAKHGKEEVFVLADSPENSRAIVEQRSAHAVSNLFIDNRKDKLHHRRSGLDHIIARFLAEREIFLVFGVYPLLVRSVRGARHVLFGRISQDLKISRKHGVSSLFVSLARRPEEMRNPKDINALFSVLGASSEQLAKGFSNQRFLATKDD